MNIFRGIRCNLSNLEALTKWSHLIGSYPLQCLASLIGQSRCQSNTQAPVIWGWLRGITTDPRVRALDRRCLSPASDSVIDRQRDTDRPHVRSDRGLLLSFVNSQKKKKGYETWERRAATKVSFLISHLFTEFVFNSVYLFPSRARLFPHVLLS